jgi:hypothetical protein
VHEKPLKNLCDTYVFVGLLVLICLHCARSYEPYTFIFRDGSFYAQTNRSIARAFTLRQENFQPKSWYDGSLPWYRDLDAGWSNVAVGANGEWYPKHSYLMPVFSTPFYVVFAQFGLLLFNALCMFTALYSAYLFASARFSKEASAIATFLLASSPLVPYLTYAYSHDCFTACLVGIFLVLLDRRRYFLSGLIGGFAIFARITDLFIVAPISLLTLELKPLKSLAKGAILPISLYLVLNFIMFGSPLSTSYHNILTVQGQRQVLESHASAFETPFLQGIRRFFSHSQEGELFEMAPLGVLSLLGLIPFALKRKGEGLALFLSFALFFVFFAKFRYGGARFFMPYLVLASVPATQAVESIAMFFTRLIDFYSWGVSPYVKKVFWYAMLALVVLGVGVSWTVRVSSTPADIVSDVEALKVYVDDIPCDYFNMAHDKWECSRVDEGAKFITGRSLGEQCKNLSVPSLWVPSAHPNKARRVLWTPKGDCASVKMHYALDPSSRVSTANFTLSAVGSARKSQNFVATRDEKVEVFEGFLEAQQTLEVLLQSQNPEVFLCLYLECDGDSKGKEGS